jgi:hypothetical protein
MTTFFSGIKIKHEVKWDSDLNRGRSKSKEGTLEQTPAPAKPSSAPMIIAVIAAALLSLCCCASSLPIFLGTGTYEVSGITGGDTGGIPPLYGLVCVGAAVIPWFIPLFVFLLRRSRK